MKANMVPDATARIVLRTWRDVDLGPFIEMSGNPEVMKYLRPLASGDACKAWMDFQVAHQKAHGFCLWAAELRESGRFVGAIGLLRVGFSAHFTPAVEIGWRIAREFWGRGYATEAARAALQFGFAVTELSEIVAHAGIANIRSHRVMTKLGMSCDRADDFDHPRLRDGDPLRRQVLYRLTRKDWLARTEAS